MEQESVEKKYYIKRTHKLNRDIVYMGPRGLTEIDKRIRDYQSGEDDGYEYTSAEFVFIPMPKD